MTNNEDWEKKLELGGAIIDFEGNLRPKGREKLKSFIRQVRDKAYADGYADGAEIKKLKK